MAAFNVRVSLMSDKVTRWLEQLGLSQYAEAFQKNSIGLEHLPHLDHETLKDIGVLAVGHRMTIINAATHAEGQIDAEAKPQTKTPIVTPALSSEAERRHLTVMFCDLVGSTVLAERLDPEELRDLLAQYQQTCADVIQHFDGHIARYVGDGLLVYFGYPQAHEDDPERAVRAGLGIVEAIQTLDTELAHPEADLAVRIGVSTGLVVAGDIGSGERVEEKAIVGETPNIAARLQALAEPNTVVIGASIQRLIEGLFDCDDLGAQHLKGISEAVNVYRVRAESDAPSRFEAKVTRGLPPLVGREEEISLLRKRWIQATEGEGQVVLLSGEAGIGKSRIVRGFREHVKDELHNQVLYYGSSYHQNSALHPAIDQLERALRFDKSNSEVQKLDKLEAVLNDLGLSIAEFAPALTLLLTLTADGRYPVLEFAPEQLKEKTLQTIVMMIQAMSSQRPVLMVVEDVHWIDPSTQELLSLLIEQLKSCRFFLLITYRPEFESPWGAYTHITSLTLNRLSRRDSTAMIARVTKGKPLPDEVLDQIVVKTDGVPLFIEELTKTVVESGLLTDAGDRFTMIDPLPPLAIPASLQDSLMARLDRLASVKEVAQLAATLGRTFSHELLGAVSPLEESELEDALTQLMHAELIYRQGLPPAVTYEFKHALVQDAAYQSLLKSTRQRYHQRIARTLEDQFPAIIETQPELVAHHYTEAQLAEPAIDYWHQAGQRAMKRSANLEAYAHLHKALELIAGLPDSPWRTERKLDVQLALGPTLMALRGWASEDVEKVYLSTRELSIRVNSPSKTFAALWGLWLFNHARGHTETARKFVREILTLTKDLNNVDFRLQAHHAAWTTESFCGELHTAAEHARRGIELYDRELHRSHAFLYGGHDPGVCCRDSLSLSLWLLGQPDQAMRRAHEAVDLAEQLDHPFSSAIALNSAMRVHHFRREVDAVLEYADKVVALCTEQNVAQYRPAGMVFRGWALTVQGHIEPGIEGILGGLDEMKSTPTHYYMSYCLFLLADAYHRVDRTADALSLFDDIFERIRQMGDKWFEAEVYRLKGELLHRMDNRDIEVEDCFAKAATVARQQRALSLELRVCTCLARLYREQGRREDVHDVLKPALSQFTEGFDTADLKEAKALLEQLS